MWNEFGHLYKMESGYPRESQEYEEARYNYRTMYEVLKREVGPTDIFTEFTRGNYEKSEEDLKLREQSLRNVIYQFAYDL